MLSGMLPQTNLGCVYLLMSLQPYQYGGIIQCHTGTGFRDIDFEPPFRRLEMIEALEDGAKLSLPKDLGSEETRNYLIEACHFNQIMVSGLSGQFHQQSQESSWRRICQHT
ncbi:unnamed protein product [Cuscuta europaea]|uniref:Uncharacterized protein n=1 Tax=Cuscuta europaea TaxID=41803 RepID=A0A9P1E225_CUSEU|nr:unnamed protein product [Cuscuta europaea]